MNRINVLSLPVIIFSVLFLTCSTDYGSALINKEWKLIEVYTNDTNIGFSRSTLTNEGYEDLYTLTFEISFISGKGAPNNFSAPYSLSDNSKINIGNIKTTMLPYYTDEPDAIREFAFYKYLENAYKWNLENNILIINSRTGDDEIVMKFE